MPKLSEAQAVKHIALYGGAFDPVHRAHLALAEHALASGRVEEVVFIPAAQSPLKLHGPIASDAQRLAMLKLAVAGRPQLRVEDCGFGRRGELHAGDGSVFCADGSPLAILLDLSRLVTQLDRWRAVDELARLVRFLVVARSGSCRHLCWSASAL